MVRQGLPWRGHAICGLLGQSPHELVVLDSWLTVWVTLWNSCLATRLSFGFNHLGALYVLLATQAVSTLHQAGLIVCGIAHGRVSVRG